MAAVALVLVEEAWEEEEEEEEELFSSFLLLVPASNDSLGEERPLIEPDLPTSCRLEVDDLSGADDDSFSDDDKEQADAEDVFDFPPPLFKSVVDLLTLEEYDAAPADMEDDVEESAGVEGNLPTTLLPNGWPTAPMPPVLLTKAPSAVRRPAAEVDGALTPDLPVEEAEEDDDEG